MSRRPLSRETVAWLMVVGLVLLLVAFFTVVSLVSWAGRMMGRPDERGFNRSINPVIAIRVTVRDDRGTVLDHGWETRRTEVMVDGATAAVTVRGSDGRRWLLSVDTATGSTEVIVTDPLPFERRIGPVIIAVEGT